MAMYSESGPMGLLTHEFGSEAGNPATTPDMDLPATPSDVETIPAGVAKASRMKRLCGSVSARLRQFYIVVIADLVCTLTDSALRLLVIMQMNASGFTAMNVAVSIAFNEVFSVATGVFITLLEYKTNEKRALILGLILQMIMLMPFTTLESWSVLGGVAAQVAYITASQCLSGVGREIMIRCGRAGRTLTTKDASDAVNSAEGFLTMLSSFVGELQGVGAFLGTLLLSVAGFLPTLLILGSVQVVLLGPVLYFLPGRFARLDPSPGVSLRRAMRLSSGAACVCFGQAALVASRDVWYAIVLPIFLRNIAGWGLIVVGTFMASWTVVIGAVQALAAPFILRAVRCSPPRAANDWPWALALLLTSCTLATVFMVTNPLQSTVAITAVVVPGVIIYAVVFGIDSTVHQAVVMGVQTVINPGYVQAGMLLGNSGGRICGLLVGSALYTYYGANTAVASGDLLGLTITASLNSFSACLWAGAAFTLILLIFAICVRYLLTLPPAAPPAPAEASGGDSSATASLGGGIEKRLASATGIETELASTTGIALENNDL